MQTPLIYDTAVMSADELEIVSTYSGRSRNSMYSTVSQVSSGGTIGLVTTMQFHSECDILSQKPVHIRASNSLNAISKNPSKKKRARTLLKSMLPKRFRVRSKLGVPGSNTGDDSPVPSEFPILNLSEEPAMKLEGKHVYFHYYFDDTSGESVTRHPLATLVPSTEHNTDNMTVGVGDCELTGTALQVSDGAQKCPECPDNAAGRYSSKSDVESGLGSQNLINTASEDNFELFATRTCVQRSQSMKCQCFMPNNNLSNSQKNGRRSLNKLPQNPSLSPLHQASCDRVDTPSSGYAESQSGCCSTQSSLYSLSSNFPLDGPPGGPDFPYHHEGFHACYHSSSLKRNSITSSGRPQYYKEPKESARSHSFNGNFTIHHESCD